MELVSVNYVAVLIAAVAAQVLGALWYGPVFGKQWMKLSGVSQSDMDASKKKGMGKLYSINFIATLVTGFVLVQFLAAAGAVTVAAAVHVAFWLWLGFVATVTLSTVLWENKPLALYVLNNAYTLLMFVVVAAILVSWA